MSGQRDEVVTLASTSNDFARSRDRWVLVDDFESGGRRYLIAEPATTPSGIASNAFTISALELLVVAHRAMGNSLKFIAIDIGLPPSTVSGILDRVTKGLGQRWAHRLVGTRKVSRRSPQPRVR
jgi:hypothetical protein